MELFKKNLDVEIAIIAEIGVNHEGDFEFAKELIRAAANAGVDAVKLQSYTPERYNTCEDIERYERLKKFSLSEQEHIKLFSTAREAGIEILSTPLSEDWFSFIAERCPAIKIASGDIDFKPVIQSAARTVKPIILSTGASTIDEIDDAMQWIVEEIGEDSISDKLVLLHCVSCYPTEIEDANLLSIPYLKERYKVNVGWSNHVIGIDACLAAIAIGASVIEVHFTDQRQGKTFRDHELSLEPLELTDLVKKAHRLKKALGEYKKEPNLMELSNIKLIRKGVVTSKNIVAGKTLSRDDLFFARPATEYSCGEIENIIGCKSNKFIKKGSLLKNDDIVH